GRLCYSKSLQSQQVISIFLKLHLQTHNLTTQAKLLFFNKFLSASPPMDVHSTLFLTPCKPVGLKF
ncbi:hypothetical protein, partial [uncultured Acinetobacter sp.]|uniref:hypothetical protein n=1 Tax=uncultured Acinetobacter sp. TaxID=165433 RepID=UPI00258EFE14